MISTSSEESKDMRKKTALILVLLVGLLATDAVFARRPSRTPDDELWGPPGASMRRGRDGYPGRMDEFFGEPVTEEQEQLALEFVRATHPNGEQWLTRMKQRSPDRYNMIIRGILFRRAQLNELRTVDSLAYNREIRIMQIGGQIRTQKQAYRRASDDETRNSVRTQVDSLLSELFDLREAEKRAEIEHMAREVERLRQVVEQRHNNKADIVRRKLEETLGERDDMEW